MRDLNPLVGTPEDPEKYNEMHKEVVNSAYEIIKLKGYTSWAIGLSVASLVSSIMKNTRSCYAVSVSVQNFHGIEKDVFLSLPVVLGENGVTHVIKQTLTEAEINQLKKSADTLWDLAQFTQTHTKEVEEKIGAENAISHSRFQQTNPQCHDCGVL
ncbi:hypothetical protein Pmani_010538 [Petrolisthes manimaculis]|uniref:Lactate/malate dehydrogenase C-terminal domain-containing protein n=1 Tax=Petrolisthes manimaculis TaxID=1843537 RepID=A0AAE1UGM1_9EUCA|nr:hypothetical protein Pmani_010538 [Petrolisthes manimaculis]